MLRRVQLVLPVLLLLGLTGCGTDEPIHSYDVPKPAEYAGRHAPSGEYRILGAMFPADDPVWFFKFQGRAADMARYEAQFDAMLHTVKLMPDKKGDANHPAEPTPPQFVAPADWTRLGERIVSRGGIRQQVFETLRIGPPEAPLEITLTRAGGSTLDNVSRWAGQIGLPAPKVEDLPQYTRVVVADGVVGLRVDVAGPDNPAAGKRPMMRGH